MGRKVRHDGLDQVDLANLRNNNYENVQQNFDRIFVLKHRKFENKLVELRAASAWHACRLVGWRPRHTILVEERKAGEVGQVNQAV